MFLMIYARSPFRDFESYRRSVFGLEEDDCQLVSKKFNSNFINFERPRDFYSTKDASEVIYHMGDYETTLLFENDDISKKTKFNFTRFSGTLGTL